MKTQWEVFVTETGVSRKYDSEEEAKAEQKRLLARGLHGLIAVVRE